MNFCDQHKLSPNGTEIYQSDQIDMIYALVEQSKRKVQAKIKQFEAEGKDITSDECVQEIKKQQVNTLLYSGVKGTYSPTDLFFVDIDTEVGVDDIIENRDTLFSKFPCICWIQKSYRGKLHLIGKFNKVAQDESEWQKLYYVYAFATAHVLKTLFGYDYYFDLKDHKGARAFDESANQWNRIEYLSPNPVYVNTLCNTVTFDTKTITKLDEIYHITDKIKGVKIATDYSNLQNNFSCYKTTEHDAMYVVDTSLAEKVLGNGYRGNELRWMLVCFAKNMFQDDDKAKQWCNKHFIDKAKHSIWMQRTKAIYGIKQRLIDWLITEKLISVDIESTAVDITHSVKESQSVYCIKRGHYISEFYDVITKHIDKYQRVCIQAPTGVGKTTIINGFETTSAHVNELLSVQQSGIIGIAKQYNADVVVPFNANNYLYSNLHEVSSMNGEKYDKTKCNVMVIDQYLKHFEESENKPVIIDESHILYMDRTYRDAVARLMVKLKQSAKKIICISATPTGEIEELHLVPLKFTNERDNINVTFVETDNIFQAEWNTIRSYMSNDKYNRIIVLDNRNNMKIAEECYFVPEYIGNYTVIRKETIEEPKNPFHNDYIQFKKNELLIKKLTLCTCVAYNGINFKNEDEKVLVLCSFTEGDTLSSELIQIIGRVRKSQVDCYVFHNSDEHIDTTELSEQIENAIKYESYVQQNQVKDEFLSYNRRLLDKDIREALLRIDNYKKDNATINKVKQALVDTGYITLFNGKQPTNIKKRENLKKKAKESQYFLQLLRDTSIDLEKLPVTNEKGEESNYMTKWRKDLLMLVSNYEGVTREFILELTDNSKKDKLIETTLEYLKDVCRICTISEQDYIHYNDCMPYLINMYKDNAIELKRISTNHRRICDMYDNWKSKISEKRNVEVCDELMLEFIKSDVQIKYAEYISKCSVGGTQSRSYKKISDGKKTYNSISDCAEKYHVPVSTISKALLKNKKISRGPLKGLTFSYI